MSNFIENFRTIHHFIRGIFADNKGEYTLTFVQDPNERWYIDIPWDGNRGNLEMVAGADALLSYLDTERKHAVTIKVVPSEEKRVIDGFTELRQIDKSILGGSHYDSTSFNNPDVPQIWICPVTLCVLGRYPGFIYVKKCA